MTPPLSVGTDHDIWIKNFDRCSRVSERGLDGIAPARKPYELEFGLDPTSFLARTRKKYDVFAARPVTEYCVAPLVVDASRE